MPGKPDRPYPGLPPLGGWFTDEEKTAMMAAYEASLDWRQGFSGAEVVEFEQAFAEYCGVDHAVALNSCGTGLDISMMCLDLEPGDEVISPAITFKATHLAIIGQGAKLVLCEIDPATFNVDPADVERKMTDRTRAIMPVHNNGLSVPMDELEDICRRHPHPKHGPPKVIPDAARAAGGEYRGTRVGKRGWMTIFSFQTSKNMTTLGEGGMITTDDPEVARRATANRGFGAGTEIWGTNYRMTRMQAAVGLVQTRRLDEMNARRIDRADGLTRRLEGVANLTLPTCPPDCKHVYYGYTVMVPPEWAGDRRDAVCAALMEQHGVGTVVMNNTTPEQHPLIRDHVAGQSTPISLLTGQRLFCIGFHPLMTDDDLDHIAASVADVFEQTAGWD